MTYDEAMSFIHGSQKLGTKLGLHNIGELLTRLGRPDRQMEFIHVAGTNGKGTVTNALARILMSSGYRVGCYTSPFVNFFEERIAVNGEPISKDRLAEITARVKTECEKMENHPTEFEIVTAIGFMYFAEQNCKYVVCEVGLGGRLDATNVIDPPLCSIITSISFDHMEYLGNTIEEIAAEKCGIIKAGSPVAVYAEQEAAAMGVIADICKQRNCRMSIAETPEILAADLSGGKFNYRRYKELYIPLLGEHMIKNACTALCAVDILREQGVDIPDTAVYDGLAQTVHTGRFEIIGTDPLFIIDGAHNISGITAFKKATENLLSGKRLVFIMGMLRDKEYEQALALVGNMAELFIAVTVPSMRSLPAEELAECAKKYNNNVYVATDIPNAVARARKQNADAIVAFGSLYMLGEFRKL